MKLSGGLEINDGVSRKLWKKPCGAFPGAEVTHSRRVHSHRCGGRPDFPGAFSHGDQPVGGGFDDEFSQDRKSTRLNSSHVKISYAVFCLKKKTEKTTRTKNKQTSNNI